MADGIIKKAIKFFLTSGLGFIFDFCAYTVMTQVLGFGVLQANFISSIIGASFVFVVSTHKIFDKGKSSLPIWAKYLIYVIYQLILIYLISKLGEWVNDIIYTNIPFDLVRSYSKLLSKILITPITMTCNFFVMRYLSERL